jgi:DNA helicase-2/ATP-dependent DNA helicase PcrA
MYDTGEGTGFRLGQRVKHAIFGEGVILRFEGSGENAVIHVNFSEAGAKRLVMQYAKLEAL